METKKSNRILKVISAILSLVITIICILVYRNKLQDFLYIPKALFSTAILILMFSIVLYLYLYFILKKIANKKIVIPIILILILVLIVAGVFFIKNNINYILRNIILMLIFIIGVVCLPLIVLGAVIIGDSKYKKILVCIVLIITVYTYVANLSEVMSYAENIIVDFSSYSISLYHQLILLQYHLKESFPMV